MIDAAIVGLGRWGRGFVESVQGKSARLRFVRAIDRNPDAHRDFVAKHGLRLAPELAEALGDPSVRAVVLATPHSLHPAQVIACAAAGKQVFCEKPFALHKSDALRMIEACRSAGVALGVGHNRRFWPSFHELRRIVAAGELGEVLHVDGHNSNEHSNNVLGGWRLLAAESPGGGMTGAGLHVLDAFVSLFGRVRRVHARLLERSPGPPTLDTVSVMLEFANGVSGMLATVRATPLCLRVHVFGTRGWAEVTGENELVLQKSGAPAQRLSFDPVNSQRAELEAFVDAIEGKAPFPIAPDQIVATVEAFEAVVDSIASGTDIVLNDR